MTATRKMIGALALVWAFAMGASEAQVGSPNGGPSKTTSRRVHPKPKEQSSVASQIEELRREMASQRQAMESQQSQIETLKQQLSQRDAQLVQAQHAAVGTEASAKQQQQQFSENAQAVASLQNSVADLKTNITSVVSTVQEQQTRVNKVVERQVSPLAFKIGAAEFTPGGFLDLTSIFRTTNVGSGMLP